MAIPEIRAVLKSTPDGATVAQIGRRTGYKPCNVAKALKAMPDVYVDRWTPSKGSAKEYAAVYALADIPEDAPYPDR